MEGATWPPKIGLQFQVTVTFIESIKNVWIRRDTYEEETTRVKKKM